MAKNLNEVTTIENVTLQLINDLYEYKSLPASCLNGSAPEHPHTGIILRNGSQSALAMLSGDKQRIELAPKVKIQGVTPRNAEQTIFALQLLDPETPLNIGVGRAGTGKTLMALAAAFSAYMDRDSPIDKIVLCKPLHTVTGRSIGALPGELAEKLAPYMSSYEDQFDIVLGERGATYIKGMIQRGSIEFGAIEFIRGRSLRNAFVIADEVQNLNLHETETLCSRIGEGAKLCLLGDLGQRDPMNIGKRGAKLSLENVGLHHLINSRYIQESPLASTCVLIKNERSALSNLIFQAFNEG